MASFFKRRSYVAVLVTLVSANTNYNLWNLVNAVMAAETQGDNTMQATGTARELTISAYNGQDGTGGNSNDIIIGDALLASGTRLGYVLSPGQSRTYRSDLSNVPFSELYAQSAATNQSLAIEITSF